MFFSVIVPSFNSERHLRQCLEALFAQTISRDQYEVILIDNNSRDRSVEIARSFPDAIVLAEKIQGSYAARNRGVRESKGEILAFTDSDCIVSPTWLEAIGSALAVPAAAVVLGSRICARESFFLGTIADYETQRTEYICTQRNRSLYYGHTNNMAVRREVFLRCGPFLEIARGADTVFVSKVLDTCGLETVRFVGEAQIRHLEIERVSDWYRKQCIYARSYCNYRVWSGTKPLGFRDRLEVMRRTIVRNRYSWVRALSLAALLAVGVIPYEVSRFLESRRLRTVKSP